MSRSQRPGGLTALAFINVLMVLAYGIAVIGGVYTYLNGSPMMVYSYGGKDKILTYAAIDALLTLLFLLQMIGFFRVSRVMGLLLSFPLFIIVSLKSLLMALNSPEVFSMASVASLAYIFMSCGLLWTVFRRDFDKRGLES